MQVPEVEVGIPLLHHIYSRVFTLMEIFFLGGRSGFSGDLLILQFSLDPTGLSMFSINGVLDKIASVALASND